MIAAASLYVVGLLTAAGFLCFLINPCVPEPVFYIKGRLAFARPVYGEARGAAA